MATIIGDLLARLGLDVSRFREGAQQAGSDAEKLGQKLHESAGKPAQALSASIRGIGEEGAALAGRFGPMLVALGAVGIGVGVAAYAVKSLTDTMRQNAVAVRDLMAVSGLGAEAADNLADTFELLGYDAATLSGAIFRMSDALTTNEKLQIRLGIGLRDTSGHLKAEGDLFLEVRDRIAAMGSAQERASVIMDVFGRMGRQLAPIFAMSREEFQKWRDEAASLSPWSEEMQKASHDLEINVNRLSKSWEGFKVALGAFVVGPAATVLDWLSKAGLAGQGFIERMKEASRLARERGIMFEREQGLVEGFRVSPAEQ